MSREQNNRGNDNNFDKQVQSTSTPKHLKICKKNRLEILQDQGVPSSIIRSEELARAQFRKLRSQSQEGEYTATRMYTNYSDEED
ncbi:unnamed protein product [Hymenolepis diminuta]|uniref:Uncharacterized protein n=1 Tax=Hymenolepis diminuta TaxID=6216 RepID=A0A564Y0T0_HYMDI|nr:unnamed protein product [Hymenolepis diminuta]